MIEAGIESEQPRGRPWTWLLAVGLLALAARSLAAPYVFADESSAVFFLGDPYFHVYRALYSLEHFPHYLSFDLYTNYPHGAVIPAAPLYDLVVAGITRLLLGGEALLERVAAWLPALLGSLTVLPIFAAGRVAGGRGVGLGAAALFALLPASVSASMVGYADHHAAVALLGATMLALQLRALAPERGPSGAGFVVGLALTRALMISTWSGSLLYLGLGDVAFVLVAVGCGRADLLRGVAIGALASAALVLPILAGATLSKATAFSAVELSYLHVVACLGLALWSGALSLLAGRAGSTLLRRLAEATALAALLGVVALTLAGAWDDLITALRFVEKGDRWGTAVLEQAPLYSIRSGAADGLAQLGAFAFVVPFAILAPLLIVKDAGMRPIGALLAAWAGVLGALTISQVRFANDFAPVGSILFALMLARGLGGLARRIGVTTRTSAGLAVATAALLLIPAITRFYVPMFTLLSALLGTGPLADLDPVLLTPQGTALRFAHEVRRVTPRTAGFLQPAVAPQYGLLADPNLGHLLQYSARRPAATNNFGPYIGRENVEAVQEFFAATDEGRALSIARTLGSRFVITNLGRSDAPNVLRNVLHLDDGAARGDRPALSRLRLVTEGPAGGVPLATLYRTIPEEAWAVPFKLFELVEGANLEVDAAPGELVRAELTVRTPLNRVFTWSAEAEAEADGRARLRVPYATLTRHPVKPQGVYRVTVGDRLHHVSVTDREVLSGARVEVHAR